MCLTVPSTSLQFGHSTRLWKYNQEVRSLHSDTISHPSPPSLLIQPEKRSTGNANTGLPFPSLLAPGIIRRLISTERRTNDDGIRTLADSRNRERDDSGCDGRGEFGNASTSIARRSGWPNCLTTNNSSACSSFVSVRQTENSS